MIVVKKTSELSLLITLLQVIYSSSLVDLKIFLLSLGFCSFTSKYQSADFFSFILVVHNIFPVAVNGYISWILENYSNITSSVFSLLCSRGLWLDLCHNFSLSSLNLLTSLSQNFHLPISLCCNLGNFFNWPFFFSSVSNLSNHQIFFPYI